MISALTGPNIEAELGSRYLYLSLSLRIKNQPLIVPVIALAAVWAKW